MALSDYFYTDGTITVTNGSTAIVGLGTAWQLRHAVGSIVFVGTGFGFIASVEDETHATLSQVWAGPTSAGAAYTIWLVPGEAATNLANNQRLAEIIQSLDPAQPVNANLTAISNLVGALDMIMVFTGPGTMRLAPKSEFTSGVTYNAYVSDITGRAAYDLQTAGYGVMVANAPGDNLLANPGFEGDFGNWGISAGVTIDTTSPHTGTKCALLDKGTVGAGGAQRNVTTANNYPVVAGESYTASAWVKGSGVSTAGLVIQVNWKDGSGAAISTVNAVANVAFTAGYVLYSGTLIAPPGAALASVSVAIATTATAQSIFVDDVSFYKQKSGRAALYVKNSATSGDWSLPSYITGPAGPLASITIGTVTSLDPGTPATVVNAGTLTAPVLNFGIPKGRGTSWKGAYNAGTGYVVDDAVLFNNSSWICIAPTTGNAPPALPTTVNAFWQLQAAKGVGDVSGPASSVLNNFPKFSDLSGKVMADSGFGPDWFTPENLCINGDFEIWQRGISFSSATLGYSADRWKFISNGTGVKNVALGTFPMNQTDVPGTPKYYFSTSVNPAGTGATFCSLATAMDCFWQTAGRKVTLTLYVRSNTGFTFNTSSSAILLRQNFGTGGSPSADVDHVVAAGPLTIPNSPTWQKLQYVVTLGGTTGKVLGASGTEHLALYLQYPLNTLCQFEIAHVSLVIGDATGLADPFVKISRFQTMQICQRFYENMITADAFGMQRTSVANQYAIHWWYNVYKYKIPTMSYTQGANGSAFSPYENQPNHCTFLFSAGSANIYALTSASAEAEII